MPVRTLVLVSFLTLAAAAGAAQSAPQPKVFGYARFATQARIEKNFLAVPSAARAGEDLRILTAEPHMAATPEDYKTAEFVAQKFREAGLDTRIVPYRVLLNWPQLVRVEAYDDAGHALMTGPNREHVPGDPFQDNPRIVMPFNGSSASGDITGEVVYANYGRIEDFNRLAALHIDLRGKIVLCRYGVNFRGVKVYLAEQRGAAGVLLYSDPQDDGYAKGDAWPLGPWRPDTGVQRGSVQFLFKYPGDPETPGVASTLNLPDSARLKDSTGPQGNQPDIPAIPLSYHDAAPILAALKGPDAPQEWQGALPFRYRLGPGGVRVHMLSRQDYQRRLIWDVIGAVRGAQEPQQQVIVGNHRDAWVFGAVDPSSGTAAMLEAVRGVGALLRTGWHPRRTLVFCSWDGEEEGLIGSTEWVEQRMQSPSGGLDQAVAYFNVDVGVSGADFSASAVPSLKEFVRAVTQDVPSPVGGSLYEQWLQTQVRTQSSAPPGGADVAIGGLGSGSDFTPFLQHAGVPSTDVSSTGPYGVYHSAFDDFAWYRQNADARFLYLQQMARVLGLEALRMADADVLPYNYVDYAREIAAALEAARRKAGQPRMSGLNFAPAQAAAAQRVYQRQCAPSGNLSQLNQALRQAESDFLSSAGLPGRPWYRHLIFAPGQYTGYAAVMLPGVNEAIDAGNTRLAEQQLVVLTQALDRAAQTLSSVQ